MLGIFDSISGIVTIISTLISIAAIFPYFPTFWKWITDKRILKSVLNSKNKFFLITQSLFKPGMVSEQIPEHYVFVTKGSVICLEKIIRNLLNVGCDYEIYETSQKKIDEIHIGGPITNEKTNEYIFEKFPNFYFVDEKDKKPQYEYFQKYKMHDNFIMYRDDFRGFIIYKDNKKTDPIKLPIDELIDYAFLIKMKSDDLGFQSDNKTVHLLFGGTEIATTVAVDFFTKNYKEIYKRAKNKHYFFAIPVSLTTRTPLVFGIRDLTKYMFDKK